jgi:hypothetical protein
MRSLILRARALPRLQVQVQVGLDLACGLRKGLLTRYHPGPRDVVPPLGSLSAEMPETLRTLEEKPWSCASQRRCHGLA